MPYQIQPIDFTGIANTFLAARDAAERRNQMNAERERQTRLEDAAAKRQGELDAMNTQRFEWERDDRVRNEARADKKYELELGQAERQQAEGLATETAKRRDWAAQQIAQDPSRAAEVQRIIDAQAKQKLIERFDIARPETQLAPGLAGPQIEGGEDAGQLAMGASSVLGEAAPEKLTGDLGEFARLHPQLGIGTPNMSPHAAKAFDQWRIAGRRAGAPVTNVTQGGVGLTTGQQGAQQGEVIKARLRLKQLGNMRSKIEQAGGYDALSAFTERGEAGWNDFMAKSGRKVDGRSMAQRAAAVAAIGGFTNPIISELAGANVPESEWNRMTQSLPDPVNDSGPALKAKIDGWEENLRIIDEFGVDYLVNGIRTGKVKLPGEATPVAPRTIEELSPEDQALINEHRAAQGGR